jgi:hypothetical protein
MCYVLKKGTTSRTILIEARDGTRSRTSVTGLSHDTSGASAAFIREGESDVQRISIVPGILGEYEPGGFVEVDPVLMPGIYQLGVPDAAFAPGADSVLLVVSFPGARIDPIEISLVAYDPQDEQRLGMSALGPEGRIAALRGAFPRLTARELVEDRDAATDA